MIVTDEIRTSAMKEITDYFQKFPTGHTIYADFLVKKDVCTESDLPHLIEVLVAEKLITYSIADDDTTPSIRLDTKGNTYFEDLSKVEERAVAQQKAEAKDTRRFWIEIIKDVLIFVAGIIAGYCFGL